MLSQPLCFRCSPQAWVSANPPPAPHTLPFCHNLHPPVCRAIADAVTHSLSLWQGPPGTGKTRTLLALIEVLVRADRAQRQQPRNMGPVLACADTNAAVDNLVEGLMHRGLRVVRLGQPAKVSREQGLQGRQQNTHNKHTGQLGVRMRCPPRMLT